MTGSNSSPPSSFDHAENRLNLRSLTIHFLIKLQFHVATIFCFWQSFRTSPGFGGYDTSNVTTVSGIAMVDFTTIPRSRQKSRTNSAFWRIIGFGADYARLKGCQWGVEKASITKITPCFSLKNEADFSFCIVFQHPPQSPIYRTQRPSASADAGPKKLDY